MHGATAIESADGRNLMHPKDEIPETFRNKKATRLLQKC
jgi:hypothetical protein